MARLFIDTSSQHLTATLANAITAYPITLFARGFDNNGANNDRMLLQLSSPVSTLNFMRLGRNDSNQTIRAVNKYGSGTPPKALSTATYSTNTYFSAAAEFGANNSRFAFLDGVRGTEDTTTDLASISNITEVTIGIELADTGDAWDGFIAEAAVWDVTLTDAEHEALAAGYSPKLIRPDALIFYDPLVSGVSTTGTGNSTDLIEGLVMVDNNGVGLADHPPTIYNSRPQILRAVAGGIPSLIVQSLTQSQSIDQPVLTQAHILTVNDITQSQTIDNVTLSIAIALLVNDLTQAQTIDLANIIQSHILLVNDLDQAQSLDAAALIQANILSVDNLTQAQLLDNVASGAIVVGFHKGEVLVFSAYNGIITSTNAHTGEVKVFNAVNIT